MNSITTHRFNMTATVLKQGQRIPDPIDPEAYGEWVEEQDPLTGEIVRVWKPFEDTNPITPGSQGVGFGTIKCVARGIVNGGVRASGTTEFFGADYRNVEIVNMWVPPNVILTQRDRVTNIRNRQGQILWADEELDDNDPSTPPKATVFNVNGVTPLLDPFNKKTGFYIMLERADNLTEGDV